MAQVWELNLCHAEQSVLLAMADIAHDDGTHCYPSVALVAWKTGYSARQVQRIIHSLADRKILIAVGHINGGRAHAVEYNIDLTKGDKKAPFKRLERVTSETQKGDISDVKGDILSVKGDIAMSPESYNHRTVIEPSPLPPRGERPTKKNPITLKTFLEDCKQRKEKPMPEKDPIFEYAEEVNIPPDFLWLCWREFVDRHKTDSKRYKDWRKAFRNCVRGNWYRLWYADSGGGMALTTQGTLAKRKFAEKKNERSPEISPAQH